MSEPIRFGTDGWRDVIAGGFTFDRVREVAAAIGSAVASSADLIPEGIDRETLVVGYDRRFLSREFAEAAAEVLSKAGYRVLLSDRPTPSQTISHAAKRLGVAGGVVITASHNPARYNGVKFKGWYGGSATPALYQRIVDALGSERRAEGGSVEPCDILSPYLEDVALQLDLDAFRRSSIRILHDPIHGAAAGLPGSIVGDEIVTTVRGEVNPSFGGVNPEPIPENLEVSCRVMQEGSYDLAICNDGDADRLGILDERGEFVSPHKLISLLVLELVRGRGMGGEIVKTFSTSRLVESVARGLDVPFYETAIGFKYVADLMLDRNILLGGEESGGIGFGSFLPERDGVLSGLLVAETVARRGRPLSAIVSEMEEEFGALHYDRRDVTADESQCVALIAKAESGELDAELGGGDVRRESRDGVKLNFADGTWILFRKSGTEPLVRIYCESPSRERVGAMLEAAVRHLR